MMVTNHHSQSSQGYYKLVLVDKWASTVGSYVDKSLKEGFRPMRQSPLVPPARRQVTSKHWRGYLVHKTTERK